MKKMADSRDMILAHRAIRHEFDALPALIRGVPAGDPERVATVADHVQMLGDMLHGHHASEDDHVWPKLIERCPEQVQPLVETMEAQHERIDQDLRELLAGARRWRAGADAAEQVALSARAEGLLPPLLEHLALEEAEILPLIDTYLTETEWRATVAASTGKLPITRAPVAMGMLLKHADAELLPVMRAAVPAVFWMVFRPLGVRAYRRYARRVYGD